MMMSERGVAFSMMYAAVRISIMKVDLKNSKCSGEVAENPWYEITGL
jgi:hypothetical protein